MKTAGWLLLVLAAVLCAWMPLASSGASGESVPALAARIADATPHPESVLTDSGDEAGEDDRAHGGACPGTVAPAVPETFPRRVALATPGVLSIGIHHQSPGQGPPA